MYIFRSVQSKSRLDLSKPATFLSDHLSRAGCLLAPAGIVDQGVMQKAGPVRLGQDCHPHGYHRVPVPVPLQNNALCSLASGYGWKGTRDILRYSNN